MKKPRFWIALVALVAAGALAVAVIGYRAAVPPNRSGAASESDRPSTQPTTATGALAPESYQGLLYGQITSILGGATYRGRLRWAGGREEAFWGDFFNGTKKQNPWVAHVPPGRLPKESDPLEILGIRIRNRERDIPVSRPFMARFGDLSRIEASANTVRVTLKSGTVFELDRLEASDFDDGVRVWDASRGVVDLDSLQIRSIDLVPTAVLAEDAPERLQGTVRTQHGNDISRDFTGFIQWNREKSVGSDELPGESSTGDRGVRFDAIRSITRHAQDRDRALVTLRDGRELVFSDTLDRGIYVDDERYGRVLIPWDAFERIDWSDGVATGPAYESFPPGQPLTGQVTTRAGSLLTGRLVYDLDESETTETLDAESLGVHYTVPFGLIASIEPLEPPADDAEGGRAARVVLHTGEELRLAGTADVDHRHSGVLVFAPGSERPEYVRWDEVLRIDLDRPAAMYPPPP